MKFILLYHAPWEAMAGIADATDEEKEAGMAQWMAWKEKCGDKVVDFGAPFMPGEITGKDGNYSPAQNEITGFSIMEADSIDEVKELVKDHPHLQWTDGCKVEIKPFARM